MVHYQSMDFNVEQTHNVSEFNSIPPIEDVDGVSFICRRHHDSTARKQQYLPLNQPSGVQEQSSFNRER